MAPWTRTNVATLHPPRADSTSAAAGWRHASGGDLGSYRDLLRRAQIGAVGRVAPVSEYGSGGRRGRPAGGPGAAPSRGGIGRDGSASVRAGSPAGIIAVAARAAARWRDPPGPDPRG